MSKLFRSILSATARTLGVPKRVDEEEFKRWRRESLDPAVRSGALYVPMPGLEDSRHYKDKQNRHHLGRYEWAARVLAERQPARVLDAACGAGYGAAILARVARGVDAVDNFEAAIRLARSRYSQPNLSWHLMDVEKLEDSFGAGSFDAVVSFQTIECVENDQKFLDDIYAILKPGGALLIDTPIRKQRVEKPENRFHRRYYGVEDWLDLLVGRFEQVQAFDALPEARMLEQLGMPSQGSIAVCTKQPLQPSAEVPDGAGAAR
jgi:2-polyprenyl-3-methyl-5-hydroxy-6-metoxy-1,4-benzoquinol methylase